MKRFLHGLAAIALLGACTTDGPSTSLPLRSELQKQIDTAKNVVLAVDIGLMTYNALTPCAETARKLCRDPATAAQIGLVLIAAGDAINVAQLAVDAGTTPNAIEKVRLAAAAAVTALKVLQSFGIG